jgi:hypothetical protein
MAKLEQGVVAKSEPGTMSIEGEEKPIPESGFVQLDGIWRFDGTKATYVSPVNINTPTVQWQGEQGVCLTGRCCRSGHISVCATVNNVTAAARLVIGYDPAAGSYYSVGINGWNLAYVLVQHTRASARLIRSEGGLSSILTTGEKLIKVDVRGQSVTLNVDGVDIFEHILPSPIAEGQVGLYVWGKDENMVTFDNLIIRVPKPRAFVVMKFGGQYDDLYREVIRPVAEKDFTVVRADDISRPGVILQDIIKEIVESDVVIANISPTDENENVFYEVGYSHAMRKPTILLADKSRKLPFDVSAFRVVFYTDTIQGKSELENELKRHLESIKQGE